MILVGIVSGYHLLGMHPRWRLCGLYMDFVWTLYGLYVDAKWELVGGNEDSIGMLCRGKKESGFCLMGFQKDKM